jgi:hypothetical protein
MFQDDVHDQTETTRAVCLRDARARLRARARWSQELGDPERGAAAPPPAGDRPPAGLERPRGRA